MSRIKRVDMKKDRFIGILAIGLLGLLGFSSCSPKLRMRKVVDPPVDTIKVLPPDTVIIKPVKPNEPIKLMYGVPPARYEIREVKDPNKKQ
jgi:hypothetical protein